jgi:hypothetical protein
MNVKGWRCNLTHNAAGLVKHTYGMIGNCAYTDSSTALSPDSKFAHVHTDWCQYRWYICYGGDRE